MGERQPSRQEASRRGPADFAELIEGARDVYYRYRLTEPRGFTYVSPSVTAMTGYTPEEFAADPDLCFVLVADDEHAFADEIAAPRTTTPGATVVRWRRKDGREIWTEQQIAPVLDEDGEAVELEVLVRDVTVQREIEHAAVRNELMARAIIGAAPDAIVGVDRSGAIVFVNERTESLFGYEHGELLGRPVETLLPDRLATAHVQHRAAFVTAPAMRPMGLGLDLVGRRKDGTEFPADISLGPISGDDGAIVAAFVRDATDRKAAEAAVTSQRSMSARRQQALEINDGVVQGISAAVLALESGDALTGVRALRATLEAARQMMSGLLEERTESPIGPGDLLRAHAAGVLPGGVVAMPRAVTPAATQPLRILIADDTEDIRTILRYALGARPGFEVIAEAANGAEAVLLAKEHRPDVVLLDLAMPVMDGLQALPKIRAVSPGTKVVVLSGYGREQVLPEARALAPDGYAEKGMPTDDLVEILRGLFPDRDLPTDAVAPPSLEEQLAAGADLEVQLANYSHELRTPLTVIMGVGSTLLERMELLPSPVVRELLESLTRNARQMGSLLDAFSDARHVGESDLALMQEEVDLAVVVRQTVADLSEVTKGHPIEIVTPERAMATVDPVRVRQVLANLLSNAAKFSPPGSPIEVAVRTGEGTVAISVTDRGAGIPSERQGRLFGRFERLGAQGRGLGLGLYLSRGIARAHGGTLHLTRSDARGSVFTLTLPVGVPANADTADPGAPANGTA